MLGHDPLELLCSPNSCEVLLLKVQAIFFCEAIDEDTGVAVRSSDLDQSPVNLPLAAIPLFEQQDQLDCVLLLIANFQQLAAQAIGVLVVLAPVRDPELVREVPGEVELDEARRV